MTKIEMQKTIILNILAEKICWERYLKIQYLKIFLSPKKAFKKVRRICLQKIMVKVLQVHYDVDI